MSRPVGVLLLIGGIFMASCDHRPQIVRLLVPDRFVGRFSVEFDNPEGAKLASTKTGIEIEIPPNGEAKICAAFARFPSEWTTEAYTYSGGRLAIDSEVDVAGPKVKTLRILKFENEKVVHGYIGTNTDFHASQKFR